MLRVNWLLPSAILYLTLFTFASINGSNVPEAKTKAAKIPRNNLSCYVCDTTVDGERCSNLNIGNRSTLLKKCEQEERTCMVKRFSYTTSTENSTSILRMWSLQRSCTSKCEPGCIIIGERTKLYACTACCNATACNTGKGKASTHITSPILYVFLPIVVVFIFPEHFLLR